MGKRESGRARWLQTIEVVQKEMVREKGIIEKKGMFREMGEKNTVEAWVSGTGNLPEQEEDEARGK